MNYLGIIMIGVLIMFGAPIGLGLGLAKKFDHPVLGIVAGVVCFVVIVSIGYKNMMNKAGENRK